MVNQWANGCDGKCVPDYFFEQLNFLWQEGHTAHATEKEAIAEAEQMLRIYAEFAENFGDSGNPGFKDRK